MRRLFPLIVVAIIPAACFAAERVDNVLAKLVPADAQTLFGARVEQLRGTPLFAKLVSQQKLPQLETFTAETGFDPLHDVNDLLLASGGRFESSVLLARGNFHIMPPHELHPTRYRGYVLFVSERDHSGFCVMDRSLAIAGTVSGMRAALNQYLAPQEGNAELLAQARAIPQQNQLWSVSVGGSDFLANNMPREGNAANFAKIFRSLENTHFQADLSRGLNGTAQGLCRTEADAKNLGDAVRGLIGFGRLSVPDNQPELLRLWDGLHVDQNQRAITITANIPQNLIDKLVAFFETNTSAGPHPRPPAMPRPPRPPME